VPNSSGTSPTAINPEGLITGSYADASGYDHGFLRKRDGSITTFDVSNVVEEIPGCPGDGWTVIFTEATAINLAGQIVGRYMKWNPNLLPSCTRLRGFLRDPNGTFTTFGGEVWPEWWPFDQATTNEIGIATGNVTINAGGLITGWYGTDNGGLPFFGFLRQPDGTITTFGLPTDYPLTYPTAINSAGQITGSYRGEDSRYHGFLRESDGTITPFDVPDSSHTSPAGIDSAGQIAGAYLDASNIYHGFVRGRHGIVTTFDVPNSTYTYPTAINQRSEIAGAYLDTSYVYHGFMRERDGTITKFDIPNSTYTYPVAINPRGEITGWYSDGSGVHGFVRSK
jgi:hypothetical protein